MHYEVETTTGTTHVSTEQSREDIQAQIDAVDGKIFTGIWKNNVCHTVDEFNEWMKNLALGKKIDGLSPTEFTLQTDDGEVAIHPKYILSFKVVG